MERTFVWIAEFATNERYINEQSHQFWGINFSCLALFASVFILEGISAGTVGMYCALHPP